MRIIIVGAGPAGLTAAFELARNGQEVIIIEKESQVGGISKTMNYNGYLFDLGGHRFFTKYQEVERIWHEVLPDDFLKRPRLSRIYFNGKLFYYPLKPFNALFNLGPARATSALLSYIKARIKPYKNPETFEQWVINQFGRKLFEIFFKTYTEKVWGIPCTEISADWAAQRIKNLSLGKAVLNAFGLSGKNKIRTLIDEFLYPRRGPGQFWEKMAELVTKMGGQIVLKTTVKKIRYGENSISAIVENNSQRNEISGQRIISSAPLPETILFLEPQAPEQVQKAARMLKYRDFFTVCLVIKKQDLFPDNWIYIHSPEITAGRMQNFKNWSPEMVADTNNTSVGLEYFCSSTDPIWSEPDSQLIAMAVKDMETLKMARKSEIIDGTAIRVPRAYPVYEPGYQKNIEIIKNYLTCLPLIQVIGRNGLHRYNNQDHSMLMGLYAASNVLGGNHSVWGVNVEEEYHEFK
jgi:protoporphyrinogen oxidase